MKQQREFQLKAIYEGTLIVEKKKMLEMQRDVLERCGLKKEASSLNNEINSCIIQIREKEKEAYRQRLMLVKEMLLCFAAADLATVCAEKVSDIFKKITFDSEKTNGLNFAQLFKERATELNKCVQLVDGQCSDERVSYLYSDMADEVVNTTLPIIYEIVEKYMNSEKGKKIL